MMRYLTRYFSLDILIYLLHIFRYLDPIKTLSGKVIYLKYPEIYFMIYWDIVGYLRYVNISFEIWLDILRYPVRYLVQYAILKDISRYWRYLIIFQIYWDISNFDLLKIIEISYIISDILDTLGYLDLFSDISGVQPLRCFTGACALDIVWMPKLLERQGWLKMICVRISNNYPVSAKIMHTWALIAACWSAGIELNNENNRENWYNANLGINSIISE